jgi:hypothetical protein
VQGDTRTQAAALPSRSSAHRERGDDEEEVEDDEEEVEDDDEDEEEEEEEECSSSSTGSSGEDESNVDEAEVAKALAAFRKCDEFLQRHRIRPEFFCRYRERLALQAWLLQRVTAKASRSVSGKCGSAFCRGGKGRTSTARTSR